MKLVEPEGNLDEKIANSEISQAMGIHTHDFDEISDPEVIECRRNIFHYVAECFHERNAEGCKSQALYKFPPEIEDSPILPVSMLDKLDKGHVKIAIWFLSDTFDKQKHTIAVKVTILIDLLCLCKTFYRDADYRCHDTISPLMCFLVVFRHLRIAIPIVVYKLDRTYSTFDEYLFL